MKFKQKIALLMVLATMQIPCAGHTAEEDRELSLIAAEQERSDEQLDKINPALKDSISTKHTQETDKEIKERKKKLKQTRKEKEKENERKLKESSKKKNTPRNEEIVIIDPNEPTIVERPQPVAQPTTPSTTTQPVAQPTKPSTTTQPITQPTTPSTTTQPVAQPTTPSTTTQPVTQPTTPSTTTQPVAQPTTPSTTTQPVAQPTTPSTTTQPVAQPTTPSTTTQPITQPTTPSTTTQPVAQPTRPSTRQTVPQSDRTFAPTPKPIETVEMPSEKVIYANFVEVSRAMKFVPLYMPRKSGYEITAIYAGQGIVELRYGRRWEPTVSLTVRTYKRADGEEPQDISGVTNVKWRVDTSTGTTLYIAKISDTEQVAAWAVGHYTFSARAENLSFAGFHSLVADELIELSTHYYLDL